MPWSRLGHSGCGYNLFALLTGEQDFYIGTHNFGYWDLCAPEALLKAAGGIALCFNGENFGKRITYDLEGTVSYTIPGVIAARNGLVYAEMMKRIDLT